MESESISQNDQHYHDNDEFEISNDDKIADKLKTEDHSDPSQIYQLTERFKANQREFFDLYENLKKIIFKLNLRVLNKETLIDLYNKNIHSKLKLVSSMLVLDLTKKEFRDLFDILQEALLPELNLISLWNVSECSSESINNFLQNSLPRRLFAFSFNNLSKSITQLSPYYESLKKVARCSVEEFQLHNLKLTRQEFSGIIEAVSHCNKVHICRCIVEADTEFKFVIAESPTIKVIVLSFWNLDQPHNWPSHGLRFKNIIKSINKCEMLKNSLQKIEIEGTEEDIKKLKKYIELRDLAKLRFTYY